MDFGSADQSAGSRIPEVSFRQNQSDIMLRVTYDLNTYPTFTHDITHTFSTGNWINLQISQINGVYEIKVDYKQVYNTTINTPKKWRNVNLLMGNTYGTEYVSTVGHYRHFSIITCPQIGKVLNSKILS